VLLGAGCAPEAQPPPVQPTPVQTVQHDQVSKLNSDLGPSDKIRAQMGAVAAVLGVASNVLIESPTAAKDPAGLQITEKALIGQQQRLNAVAESKSDDDLVATVADLCTGDALADAEAAGSLLGGVAAITPSKRISNDDDKLDNFKRNQHIYEQSALYLIEIQTRCARSNPPAPVTQASAAPAATVQVAPQGQDQEEEAPLNTAVLNALLAAQITAPQVDAIEKQNQPPPTPQEVEVEATPRSFRKSPPRSGWCRCASLRLPPRRLPNAPSIQGDGRGTGA
jgi:hypothetical protein